MRRFIPCIAGLLLLASGCAGARDARLRGITKPGLASGLIYVAETAKGRVLVTDEKKGLAGASQFWSASEAEDLVPVERSLFSRNEINECKPGVFRDTRVVLVTAWPRGFAVLRASDGKVLVVQEAPRGVHSAEVLEDDTLVTISASGGDCVKIYSTVTSHSARYPIEGGRGVVWDKKHKCLWALGTYGLQRYAYNFDPERPALTLIDTLPLPSPGGHDLYPRAWRDELFVTTYENVWVFSTRTGAFAPYAPLSRAKAVKSIGENRYNGRVLFTGLDQRLYFLNPSGESEGEALDIYKARWDRLPEVTYGSRRPYGDFGDFPPNVTTTRLP